MFFALKFHGFFWMIEGPLQEKGKTGIWLCKYLLSAQKVSWMYFLQLWWCLVSFMIFWCIGAETKSRIFKWIKKRRNLYCLLWVDWFIVVYTVMCMFECIALQITFVNSFYIVSVYASWWRYPYSSFVIMHKTNNGLLHVYLIFHHDFTSVS